MTEDISLRILGVDAAGREIAGARPLLLRTTRGPIRLILHAAAAPASAVLCVSGAAGGFDGPALLYPRLGLELASRGSAVVRLNYRVPGEFGECVADALAALAFLRGTGHSRLAVVGHSFGGAVAINAGTLSPQVTTVVAISSQLAGAHVVEDLPPRSLLVVHGTADPVLPYQSGEAIFERAREPKKIELIEDADHGFSAHAERLYDVVSDWLDANL